MRRSTLRRTALFVSMLSATTILAILGTTSQVEALQVGGVALSVPAPWVAVAASIQFATSINWYVKMFKLFLQLITGGGKEAACDLCDEVVTIVLELDDTKDSMELDGDDLCDNICPFRIQRCVSMCSRLLEAIKSSTKMPCEAIGVCESLDEFGENPECSFSWARGCQPAAICARSQSLPFPKCDLKPGKKKWKRVTRAMQENVGALALAVQSLPKCGQPGAHEVFCVDEPTGLHLFAEYAGYVLIFVVATAKSVYAIETPGGDDDRQWLSFWMIFFLFTVCERFTDVILSRFGWYYECKLLVLTYLILYDGASGLYYYVHSLVRVVQRSFLFRPLRWLIAGFSAPPAAEEEVQGYLSRRLKEKEDDAARKALLDAAEGHAKELLAGEGLLAADQRTQRLDHWDDAQAAALRTQAEGLWRRVEATLAAAKQEQKKGGRREKKGAEVDALLGLKRRLRAVLRGNPPKTDPASPPSSPESSEALAVEVAGAEAAQERLRRARRLLKQGFERAHYEYVMAHVAAPVEAQPLRREFTLPATAGLGPLSAALVPVEKMLSRLLRRPHPGPPQAVGPDAGLPPLPAAAPSAKQLAQVINKTEATDWKPLEVRYLEVRVGTLSNVPPMDNDGRCQPFLRLYLVQLQGQEHLIKVSPPYAASGRFALPRRILDLDLAASAQPFRAYSHVRSKVQSRLALSDASPPVRTAKFDQNLELPVEGGSVDLAGEYENTSAPFHVLVGELWDADVFTPSDLAGYFQVPCCILMDGLPHHVECEIELTAEAAGEVAKNKAKAKGFVDGPITLSLVLQYAP